MVICALLRDFDKHGEKAIARVREENPGMYLQVIAMVLPRQHKVEHTDPLSRFSNEQLEAMLADLEERIERQRRGEDAKVIEGEPRRPNKVMEAADTALGPQERKPRKRKVPPPGV